MDEAAFRKLICGKRQGIVSALLRCGLAGLSLFYRLGVALRNRAFDCGCKRSFNAPVPVISVGNLTTGGTGKTPFVAFLANWFSEQGLQTVLLSRGYRAVDGETNDEKLVLDRLCPDVAHLQNPNRVASAETACREHAARLLILDDGFQHRRLQRDLDIVLIDALNPWGYGRLLPRGLLREPLSGLKRADLIVLTRADQVEDEVKDRIKQRIQNVCGPTEVIEVAYPPDCLVNSADERVAFDSLQGKPIVAFCGIGNPDGFRRTIDDCNLQLFGPPAFVVFPDHHHYRQENLSELARLAKKYHVAALVTTLKDLVKIDRTDIDGVPLWAVQIGTRVLAGTDELENRLHVILDRCKQN